MTGTRHLRQIASMAAAAVTSLMASAPAAADQAAIGIDGAFEDWSGVAVAHEDPIGDGSPSGVDFHRLWIADDERFLFLRLEIGFELNLQEANNLRLYLDTDANPATGLPVQGIGAELQWLPGSRSGFFYFGGDVTAVAHPDIGFRAGPTVTSEVFELAFGRDSLPDGVNPLFPGSLVRIVVHNGPFGDRLPDTGSVAYLMDQGAPPPQPSRPLAREHPADLRLVTYNVRMEGLFHPAKMDRFQRQLTAVEPDIVMFQEINGHNAVQTAALLDEWLGGPWHGAGYTDCRTISRFPIIQWWPFGDEIAVLIDATEAIGGPVLIVNAHLPFGDQNAQRQEAIDRIMMNLRVAQQPGSPIAPGTPIIICGDLNLVGYAQQLTTLLSGDIVDESTFGPDFDPDWDGTGLANLISCQTEKRMGYTWRDDLEDYWPGHLDYFIHTDSVLEVRNHFLLYTPEMSADVLVAHGLLASDSLVSDHLLFCADFRRPCPADLDGSGAVDVADLLALLAAWGPCSACPADLDGDGMVDVLDLLQLLSAWGPC